MEDKKENDLFFTCSLIEFIARNTNNTKKDIINYLGKEKIEKIYNLAEVYHSEVIEKVCDDFINECKINKGNYNLNVTNNKPSFWNIDRVYQRLILSICNKKENKYIDTLIEVLSSWIIPKIDNYNSSMYYENPEYIYQCYIYKKIL